jgi:cytochrome c5
VNRLFKKIWRNKKLFRSIVALKLIIVVTLIYVVLGVNTNLQKMAAMKNEQPTFATYPLIENTRGRDPNLVKRGEYLAKAGDCIACHTNSAKKGKTFAGGLPMPTPFGTIYSPNITPDKETGIGNWSEEDFIKAMREGISPHGQYYYPAFPYLYFNKISTIDLRALKAYLDSIPAIHQENLANDMVFPFNIRFLQLGWRLLFFYPANTGPYVWNKHQSDQWNQGAYLVEGLGHCAMCHSPSYHLLSESVPLGAPMRQYNLTGAKIQGYLAPNITKSNIGNISEQEIVDVFTKDRLIGGGKVEGPMLEANHDSLVHLTQDDLFAIAHYLRTVESKTPPKPSTEGGPGKATYEAYCSGCHASGSGGAPKYGDPAGWEEVLKNKLPVIYLHAIKGIGNMPAKGTCLSCTDDEIKQAVDVMIAATKGENGPTVARKPKPKPLSIEDGKRIYNENCGVCHNSGFKGAHKPGDIEAWKPIVNEGFLHSYLNVLTGRNGHPPRGACTTCSDAEIKAAVKYLLETSSTNKEFSLW